jgi:D-alanyl-lipoteichoic acid acyltransferase DltB (MBOAT superfamily)
MIEHLIELCSSPPLASLAVLLLFPLWVGAWSAFAHRGRPLRGPIFTVFNLAGAFVLCVFVAQSARHEAIPNAATIKAAALPSALYVALVLMNFYLLRRSTASGGFWTTAALWAPIVMLVAIKYLPVFGLLSHAHLLSATALDPAVALLGLSYLSFRLCYVAQEVQNDVVPLPSVWDYLSFAFFVPTLTVGPISPYRLFAGSLDHPDRAETPVLRSLMRTLVGLVKYLYLATLLSEFGYSGLLLDGHPHALIDFIIAVLAYPLFLYANFSGLCDVVIGASGLMRIRVMENFDRPFSSRNFQVFWSRWHISLSTFLREMMFTPLVKLLAQRFGTRNLPHAIALSILCVFVVIGIWHGAGLNFVLFGISQGVGVATIHYSSAFMRKRLGKDGFARYQKNGWIYGVACACTYLYFALTMILFANSWEQLQKIVAAVQW